MASTDNYWVLLECSESDSALISNLPDDCPPDRKFLKGKPIADKFPSQVNLHFSKAYSNNTKLYDFLDNTLLLRIVSDRTKRIFDTLGVNEVEYIPVTIHDHQGSVVADNYFIVNVINTQPIIDLENSEYRLDNIDSSKIARVNRLCVATDEIDSGAKLFRSDRATSLYFITNDTLNALQDAGITGIRVIKAEGWDGNDLEF